MDGDPGWYDEESWAGSLVEVFGLEGPLEPSPDTQAANPGIEAVEVNGQTGRIIGWSDDDEKLIVETFDGVLVGVPEANLRDYEPPRPEDGGFDLAWPSGSVCHLAFAEGIVECLAGKGYCVVQLFTSPTLRAAAQAEASEILDWNLLIEELEAAYMGYSNSTKYSALAPDVPREEWEAQDQQDALHQCDQILDNLGRILTPLTPNHLGFEIWGRHISLVRAPFTSVEEQLLRPAALSDVDYEDGGKVFGHLNFLDRRKLSAMYFIENTGGEVLLHPTEDPGTQPVRVPLARNRLLLFLPDLMAYTYRPQGDHLLLQTWYITEPFVPDPDDKRVVELPPTQHGERVHVTALDFRYAGAATGTERSWSMWIAGTDAAHKIPMYRFDVDLYYSDDKSNPGLMYTNHGACVEDSVLMGFDNEFFGIPYEVANYMGPAQRNILEVGYSTLMHEGYTRDTARGLELGVYLGDAGTDYVWAAGARMIADGYKTGAVNPHVKSGCQGGITASRLSHTLGLRGPCVGIDTACSSSLVALGQAHRTLVARLEDQRHATIGTPIKKALFMGVSLLDGPQTFFAYCAATMLSLQGRCFTFDESANGFLRGEGIGASFLQLSDTSEDAHRMMACVIGSNVNQDGRSASMTAPNGPSQQRCIRASMAESGLKPNQITIAECHGTGTALGDPIEVSALRDVMKDRDEDPIIMTSAKSNFGHMEACAGIGGITKCIVMLNAMTGASNIHLRHINPHIEYVGYPAIFISELVDCGTPSGISGVSSFGVGGTNARGDLWGRSVKGHRTTTEINMFKHIGLRSALYDRVKRHGTPGPSPTDRLFLTGTWSTWSTLEEMQQIAEGVYSATVGLGGIRVEQFRIVLNENRSECLYPAVSRSGPECEIQGPDWEVKDRAWLLDARGDAAQTDAVYRITFKWSFSWDVGEHRHISWERLPDPVPLSADWRKFAHSYHLVSSVTAWKCKAMGACEESCTHEIQFRIGISGEEEFYLVRDRDMGQAIYPAEVKAMKSSIPVRGPDHLDAGRRWLARGPTGEHVTVRLQVTDESIVVTTISPTKGQRSWRTCYKALVPQLEHEVLIDR